MLIRQHKRKIPSNGAREYAEELELPCGSMAYLEAQNFLLSLDRFFKSTGFSVAFTYVKDIMKNFIIYVIETTINNTHWYHWSIAMMLSWLIGELWDVFKSDRITPCLRDKSLQELVTSLEDKDVVIVKTAAELTIKIKNTEK